MHFYDQALLPCVVPNREFLRWDAQEQLGNATWEWPKPWKPDLAVSGDSINALDFL